MGDDSDAISRASETSEDASLELDASNDATGEFEEGAPDIPTGGP